MSEHKPNADLLSGSETKSVHEPDSVVKSEPEPPSETLSGCESGSELVPEPVTMLGSEPLPHPQAISEPLEGSGPKDEISTNQR